MSATHWTAADLGVKQTRDEAVDFFNSLTPGSFIFIKRYCDQHGRVTDRLVRFGIVYPNVKAASLRLVEAALGLESADIASVVVHRHADIGGGVLADTARTYAVNRDLWPYAIRSLRGFPMSSDVRKRVVERDGEKFSVAEVVEGALADLHPGIPRTEVHDTVFFAEAMLGVREGIVNPQQRQSNYTAEGRSLYSHADELNLTIRDVLSVGCELSRDESGAPICEGHYPERQKEQNEVSAIKDAIKGMLPIGNYREFKLKWSSFESISAGGQTVMMECGIPTAIYIGMPELCGDLLNTPKEQVNA